MQKTKELEDKIKKQNTDMKKLKKKMILYKKNIRPIYYKNKKMMS